jgi:prophage antirepressor-like protein
MLVINEHGIYQALFRSRRLEARQFTNWVCDMLEDMRAAVGLQPYEVMQITEPEIQRDIDEQLGEAFYDYETDSWRIQRTIENGDVLVYDEE